MHIPDVVVGNAHHGLRHPSWPVEVRDRADRRGLERAHHELHRDPERARHEAGRARAVPQGHEGRVLEDAQRAGGLSSSTCAFACAHRLFVQKRAAEKKEAESDKTVEVQVDDLLTFRQFSKKAAEDIIDVSHLSR